MFAFRARALVSRRATAPKAPFRVPTSTLTGPGRNTRVQRIAEWGLISLAVTPSGNRLTVAAELGAANTMAVAATTILAACRAPLPTNWSLRAEAAGGSTALTEMRSNHSL